MISHLTRCFGACEVSFISKTKVKKAMQVLAGKYRGIQLQSSRSTKLRPTSRRMRESLFDILLWHIKASRFLDLCAGSGAIGIEALSRGAAHSTFVERSPKFCSFIRNNLIACRVREDQARIVNKEALHFLKTVMGTSQKWEVIVMDPPYSANYDPFLDYIKEGKLFKPHKGILVIEHHFDREMPDEIGLLRRWRLVRNGESGLSFYERRT
jgi:16S rRNA (guanine(966)-N(2))-methyltransferase RsmD